MLRFCIGLSIVLLPLSVNAEIVISEIMYDLPGSDSGREWIEIQNTGASAADISGWKLFEGNTNHGIATTTEEQSFVLLPGAYAVIADSKEAFRLDWKFFGGLLFDSSFSLSNTGETIALRDGTLSAIDTVIYTSALGANGDGKTLFRTGNSFFPGKPTPGNAPVAPIVEKEVIAPPEKENVKVVSTKSQPKKVSAEPQEKQVEISQAGQTSEVFPQTAAVTAPAPPSIYPWLLSLGGIVVLGLLAFTFLGRKSSDEEITILN